MVQYPDLLVITCRLRYQECTDERDKVFGLLGLADPSFAKDLIDITYNDEGPYNETISFLNHHFAAWHTMRTDTLNVFMCICFGAAVVDDLPYWMPGWSQEAAPRDTDWKVLLKKIPHRAGAQCPASFEFISN